MSSINLGKIKIVYKGEYSELITYNKEDVVYYNGSSYIALQRVLNILPTALGDNWEVFSLGKTTEEENYINTVSSINPNLSIELSKKVAKLPIVQSNGSTHTMHYLMADGTIKGVGRGAPYFACGDSTNRTIPNIVSCAIGSTRFTDVYVGNHESFAIDTAGNVWAWGNNAQGQLGIGNTTNQMIMRKVIFPAGTQIIKVIPTDGGHTDNINNRTTFFITSTGKVYATGNNLYGQLGQGNTTAVSTPVVIGGDIENVSIKDLYVTSIHVSVYAISSDGQLYVWGWNAQGQLGTGNTNQLNTPTLSTLTTTANATVSKIMCNVGTDNGVTVTCSYAIALMSNGNLWSTGYNEFGQLGSNNTTSRANWGQITGGIGGTIFKDINAQDGYYGSVFAIDTNNNVWAWGYNGYGQLGLGNTTQQNLPVLLTGAFQGKVLKVKTGGGRSFISSYILTNDNQLYSAGNNDNGALGQGDTNSISTFKPVAGIQGTIQDFVVCGESTSGTRVAILLTDGRAFTFGWGGYGNLGTRINSDSNQLSACQVIF